MPKVLVCVAFMTFAVLAPQPLAAEVIVRIDESGAVIVPVTINGSGPFSFVLDTGSTHSVVSQSLVERLALRIVAKTSVSTSTGHEWRRVVEMDQATIGPARSDRLLPSVAASAQLDAVARGVDGIIGQDFLFAFNYTLDYRRRRLSFTDDGASIEGTRLPLVRRGGRYLVQVSADSSAALLVPDSGANGFVIFERDGFTPLRMKSTGTGVTLRSIAGTQAARTMMLSELKIGDVRVRDQLVAVVTQDVRDETEGDGLLPLHVFASVTFNAREQCLVVRR